VFREIARVLRPGGRIAISDIVAEDLPPLVREDPAAYYACIGGAITEADYLAGLGDAGFADLRVTERIVYTAEQLEGMLRAERTAGVDLSRVREETAKAAGSIWSARFEGRKA
jgi:arsenite methyltransferase